jgi:hypothetical protein
MTPKEKAQELFDKYWILIAYKIEGSVGRLLIKQCALIAVDEILETTKTKWATQYLKKGEWIQSSGIAYKKYWLDVKTQIEKL